MLNIIPVSYQIEESSIFIEKIKPEVYVVREDDRYLNDHNEWTKTPTPFSFESAKQVVENYFDGLGD
jgi:hypothetical protein